MDPVQSFRIETREAESLARQLLTEVKCIRDGFQTESPPIRMSLRAPDKNAPIQVTLSVVKGQET